ncbi:flagellar hook-associated family protein [Aurantimonas sp. MSK8Z-1]|uniref:flagellar hook-associated family protein n=1 Tax=Mangrovibrevibacter kandeliae TaxID=2968473 RepID=UPI0021173CCC|nr:flagellar hook-associated family protein [Aurantimonas sp. MSK8Z-1]MCW4113715.1 flagellar hook-associated family protein [Aurantimonas sp. MSK8Z-1]
MSISSLSLISAQRSTILRAQEQLRKAEVEVSSGRYADVGTTLGATTGHSVTLYAESTSIKAQLTSNTLVTQRLSSMQDVLGTLSSSAQDLVNALIQAGGDKTTADTIATQAKAALEQMSGALNTTVNGIALFSGTNTDTSPIDTSAAAKTALADNATDALDTWRANKLDADPTNDDFQAILAANFDTVWRGNVSSANDATVENRITPSETITVSSSANSDGFQRLARAYSMLSTLATDTTLSTDERSTLYKTAINELNAGQQAVTSLQTDIGLRQDRVDSANTRLQSKQTVIKASISSLEDVDPYEASTRVTMLTTQLEAAYSMTSQLKDLSLLNYL